MIRFVFLFLLVGCASCRDPKRLIDICQIFTDEEMGYCAKGDKKSQRTFPWQFDKWTCWSELSQQRLGEKLEQCELDGKLPRGDKTWQDMNTCLMNKDSCDNVSFSVMDGYFCTNDKGKQMILSRLEFCTK